MNDRINVFFRPLLAITLAAALSACGETTEPTDTSDPQTTQRDGKGDDVTARQSLTQETDNCREAGADLVEASYGTPEQGDAYAFIAECMADVRSQHLELLFGKDAGSVATAVDNLRLEAQSLCDFKGRAMEPDETNAAVLARLCDANVDEAINYLLDGGELTSYEFERECARDKTLATDQYEMFTILDQERECTKGVAEANIQYLRELLYGELPHGPEDEIGEEVASHELDETEVIALEYAEELAYVLSGNEDLDSATGELILTQNMVRTLDLVVTASSDPFSYDE